MHWATQRMEKIIKLYIHNINFSQKYYLHANGKSTHWTSYYSFSRPIMTRIEGNEQLLSVFQSA